MREKSAIAAFLLTSLGACTLAPDYHVPETPPVAAYKEAGDWIPAAPADAKDRGPWWKLFGDPTLDGLEDKVTSANQNLKVALAQYDEARADVATARADYFPTITADASSMRQELSKNVTKFSPLTLYNAHTLGADISYELDVWGRVRSEVTASESRASASAADLATVDLSLHAELATDFFMLRSDDSAQKVWDDTVIAYQKAFELTQQLHNGGAAAEVDVDQAQTQLENAKTQAADTRMKRAQLEHAIAVLTGQPPAAFSLPAAPLDIKAPPINPGLSSTLLERRPDIASAARLTEAANSDIGVARAAYFPTFDLTASGGVESALFSSLFRAPSIFWSLGPTATMPIFEGGRINALNDKAKAAYDESVANYRQTVLTAYQQVEDNLVALRQLEQEQQSQAAATAAAERALKQAKTLYSGGLTTYLQVVTSQNTALQAELSSVEISMRQLTASVGLIKALGGGWKEGDAPNAQAPVAPSPVSAAPIASPPPAPAVAPLVVPELPDPGRI